MEKNGGLIPPNTKVPAPGMGGLSRLGGHGNQDRHAMLYGIIIFSANESKERVAKKKKTSKQGFH